MEATSVLLRDTSTRGAKDGLIELTNKSNQNLTSFEQTKKIWALPTALLKGQLLVLLTVFNVFIFADGERCLCCELPGSVEQVGMWPENTHHCSKQCIFVIVCLSVRANTRLGVANPCPCSAVTHSSLSPVGYSSSSGASVPLLSWYCKAFPL